MTVSFKNSAIKLPLSGKAPKQLVVLLHGYGSNAQDLISLAPYWQQGLPEAVFVSPNAPEPCEMAPTMGYQWFSLRSGMTAEGITVKNPALYLPGVKRAAPLLDAFLDEVLAFYKLEDKDLALMGFSQGSMMALHSGPRRLHKIAGVLAYSGSLIDEQGLETSHKIPVFLAHGEADDVVPFESYTMAKEILEKHHFPVTGQTNRTLGHGIDNDGIEGGIDFLQKIYKSL